MKKVFILVVGSMLLTAACSSADKQETKKISAPSNYTEQLPAEKNIMLLSLKGDVIGYKTIADNQKNILFFWTTWCPYCRKELASFSTPEKQAILKGYNIHYINIGERMDTVRAYADKVNLSQEIRDLLLMDTTGALGDKFAVMGIPVYALCKGANNCKMANGINEDILKQYFEEKI